MAQALVFPLGVLWGGFGSLAHSSRGTREGGLLEGGMCVTHLYLMFATGFCPSLFAFGYDLVLTRVKILTTLLFGFSAAVTARGVWNKTRSRTNSHTTQGVTTASDGEITNFESFKTSFISAPLATAATVGLLWFAIQPLVVGYPLATIPTILGKRLSRAASAFTFLGAIEMMTMRMLNKKDENANQRHLWTRRTIGRGLGIGSALHLALILLKLIGVDDGGLLLPGRGLWTWYPAMMAVPWATAASCVVHFMTCLACCC